MRGASLFPVLFVGGVFITTMFFAEWILEKLGIRLSYRYMHPSGFIFLFIWFLLLFAIGGVFALLRLIF